MSPRTTVVVSHARDGEARVELRLKRGVWGVTRAVNDRGWVATHLPSGCAVQYNGVLHRLPLAKKIVRALYETAPAYRQHLPLLRTDAAQAARIVKEEDAAPIKAALAKLYEQERSR